jgi:hypothetical protein
MDRKAIEMSYVKRTEVCMEGVIKKSIVCGEIHRVPLLARSLRLASRGSFAGRFGLFEREGERSLWVRWGVVGSEVQAICDFKWSESLPDKCEVHIGRNNSSDSWDIFPTDRIKTKARTLDILDHLAGAAHISRHCVLQMTNTRRKLAYAL